MGRERRIQNFDGSTTGKRGCLTLIGGTNLKAPLIACLLLCFASQAFSQSNRGLPAGAVVLETRKLLSVKHPDREIVLWMLNPKKNPDGYRPGDLYTCPDQTRGSYYSGPARVSLLNAATKGILNTIKIVVADDDGVDSVDLPFAIL